MTKTTLLCVGALALLVTTPAFAEEPPRGRTSSPSSPANLGEVYGYAFEDDALLGDSAAATGHRLKVRKPRGRTLLIRPRVQFVTELVHTLEQL